MSTLSISKLTRKGKSRYALELAIVVIIFLINELFLRGNFRYSAQFAEIVALILISVFLMERGSSWAHLGLRKPNNVWKAAGLTILCVITIGLTFNFIIQPLFPTGANSFAPNPSTFAEMIFRLLVFGIGTAAIGEELLFRGFILNNLNRLFGKNFLSMSFSIFLQAFLFAILHSGLQGMVSAGVIGIILGIFYIWSGRSLWVVIVAHAVPDVLSIVQSYQN